MKDLLRLRRIRPNVLLIVLDAARRDALEPYGAPAAQTPAIAQLARAGLAHDEVYATGCWTVPSHASIFTGLLPRAAGLAQVPGAPEAHPLVRGHAHRLLPHVLRRAGYATVGASANFWISAISGFSEGFDQFEQAKSDRHARMQQRSRREHVRWLAEAVSGRVDDGAADAEEALVRMIRQGRKPFFAFVNLLECHSPYLPPRPFGRFSPLERVRAAEDARRYYTLEAIWRVCGGIEQVPDEVLGRARTFYRAAIEYMDRWVSQVLERLQEGGLLDETLVIVTSDHGENLGEGGLIAHGLSLDNRLIRVPFVAAGPGADRPLSSLAELPRFIAHAIGLEDHPWVEDLPPGCGIAQYDPPVTADDAEGKQALVDLGLGAAVEKLTTPLTCSVAGSVKVLERGPREELYDLENDPLELSPLPFEHFERRGLAQEVARLRAVLEQPMVKTVAPSVATAPASPATSTAELDDLEERMRLLGYM